MVLATTVQTASEQHQQQGADASQSAYAISSHVTVPSAALVGELGAAIQQQLKLKVRVAFGEGAHAASYRHRLGTPTLTHSDAAQAPAHMSYVVPPWICASAVLLLACWPAVQEEGNAAIKAGRHQEAVDKYTAALALGCPPAYAAVLHCNRAAAHSGLGAVAEAVADCGRARALDPTYYKAACRLAGGRFWTRVAVIYYVLRRCDLVGFCPVTLSSWLVSGSSWMRDCKLLFVPPLVLVRPDD